MQKYLSLIKFSHTIFAMPFAMTGFFLGYSILEEPFQWVIFMLVVMCMVFGRSAAMAFNRWLDRDVDANNPRTKVREIPAGLISADAALWFVVMNSLLFIISSYFINPLCFVLSPIALMVILGYSYTKRFTALCHIVLGVGLALAPVGAYLAVTARFDFIPVLFGFAVMFWVAGFDIIYALQDEDFDKNNHLNSIPAALGRIRSMRLSQIFHVLSAGFMVIAVFLSHDLYPTLGITSIIGLGIFCLFLIYQHMIIKPSDLSRVNMAFFTTNGASSLIFGTLFIVDLMI
ncbi:MAG: UbiA family prenyltransferase [Saprospiraceae bacterium]|nr:UbiA family prenyltransferase [Saprospiraceae bacterium]